MGVCPGVKTNFTTKIVVYISEKKNHMENVVEHCSRHSAKERIFSDPFASALERQLASDWLYLSQFMYPSAEISALPIHNKLQTLLVRQCQNVCHNLICWVVEMQLKQTHFQVFNHEPYFQLLNHSTIPLIDPDMIPVEINSQIGTDVIAVANDGSQYRYEVKTTLKSWNRDRIRELTREGSTWILFSLEDFSNWHEDFPLKYQGISTTSWELLIASQAVLRRIKTSCKYFVDDYSEVMSPGQRLEKELSGQALKDWYDHFVKKWDAPPFIRIVREGPKWDKFREGTETLLRLKGVKELIDKPLGLVPNTPKESVDTTF